MDKRNNQTPKAVKISGVRNFKYMLYFLMLYLITGCKQSELRPNIVWITIEDWSTDLSCYGTKGIATPHVDKLASEGVRFNNAFTTSPVCSSSRSALMTGFHQNYIGANQHRLMPEEKKELPYGIKPIPILMKEAGYFTALMTWKTDCNFLPDSPKELFEGGDWSERKRGQPFFARITIDDTHRYWVRDPARPIPTDRVELPPYYPQTEFSKRDWANGLEQMQLVDRQVGAILKRLTDEGHSDNTIVFFTADNGRCHVRGKQFLYDPGVHVPLIVRWPGKTKPGTVNDNLVYAMDINATCLAIAGATPTQPLHAKDLFGHEAKKRKYIFTARDKMDNTHDAMRSIRSREFKLIHNLMSERPYCQYNHYKETNYPMLAELHVLHAKDALTEEQAAFLAPTKPEFELYDLINDPHEINNLADSSAYAQVKVSLLQELNAWRTHVIKDQGVSEEFRAADVYPDSCNTSTVNEWVVANQSSNNYVENGWPAWYPTRSEQEWQRAYEAWHAWVFREPGMLSNQHFGRGVTSKKENKSKIWFEETDLNY